MLDPNKWPEVQGPDDIAPLASQFMAMGAEKGQLLNAGGGNVH